MAIVAFLAGGITGTMAFSLSWLLLGVDVWTAVQLYFSVALVTVGLLFIWRVLPSIARVLSPRQQLPAPVEVHAHARRVQK